MLALRIALAGVFWRSGRTKVVEGRWLEVSDTTRFLFEYEYAGVPLPPDLAANLATWSEHLFPVLLVLGLATRGSALALLGMTMVIQIFVFPEAWWPVHSLWAAMALVLVARGGGVFALDRVVEGAMPARMPGAMIADERTLARLMRGAQAGDKRAYAALLEEAAAWLRRYYQRRIAPAQLDDLVQETLLSLHAKRASYDPARPFLPWLAAIARYRWVDHLRRVYRREEVEWEDRDFAEPPGQEAAAARISLDRLLGELPPAQARAIELVKIEGQSVRDAAASSGQSESLIKVNIHRGLKKLAALVEEAG